MAIEEKDPQARRRRLVCHHHRRLLLLTLPRPAEATSAKPPPTGHSRTHASRSHMFRCVPPDQRETAMARNTLAVKPHANKELQGLLMQRWQRAAAAAASK
ncbi:unnamed protein product [Pleuronectes platessa]|uniref:Uncharacterized protein n=1 Tax=Pleuronectes platessa TaxID=8262 RepID=A0A9N7Z8W3_PLEPL|nr:unnamed protein product [Pleuronectes platessa]